MLTPQAIKDQEFQIKFRGYDAIEVKSYLELLAEDYFELHEQNRVQAEEVESLVTEQEILLKEQERLENEVRLGQENNEEIQYEIQDGYKQKNEEIEELKKQVEEFKVTVAQLEEENDSYSEKIAELVKQRSLESQTMVVEEGELGKLRDKLELAEEKNRELIQEGLDFKTTILAAQKFADNLRETSEQESHALMAQAKADAEKFRKEAKEELAHLPKEIDALQKKKMEVREELEAVLHLYLENLDVFPEIKRESWEDDQSDLFQSIQLSDGEDLDLDNIDSDNMKLS